MTAYRGSPACWIKYCRKHRSARHGGLTLVELIVAVAVVSILAAIAAPSFRSVIANQRAKAVVSSLFLSLTKARSEAMKRNATVKVVPVAAGWSAGWSIPHPTVTDAYIEQQTAPAGASITGPTEVAYRSSGRLSPGTSAEFELTASGITQKWCISVDLNGRPYQKTGPCS